MKNWLHFIDNNSAVVRTNLCLLIAAYRLLTTHTYFPVSSSYSTMSRFTLLSLALLVALALCGTFTYGQVTWSTMYHSNPVIDSLTNQPIPTSPSNSALTGITNKVVAGSNINGHVVAIPGDTQGTGNARFAWHTDYVSGPQNDYGVHAASLSNLTQVVRPILVRLYSVTLGDAYYVFYWKLSDPHTLWGAMSQNTANIPGNNIQPLSAYQNEVKVWIGSDIAYVSATILSNQTIFIAIGHQDGTVNLVYTTDWLYFQDQGLVVEAVGNTPIDAVGQLAIFAAQSVASEALWFAWVDSVSGNMNVAMSSNSFTPQVLGPETTLSTVPVVNQLGVVATASSDGLTVLIVSGFSITSPNNNQLYYSVLDPVNVKLKYSNLPIIGAVSNCMPAIIYARVILYQPFGNSQVAISWCNSQDSLLYTFVGSPF